MHRHECNTHNFLFNLENQSKDFSYTIFPVKKINVGKILKLRENRYLITLSTHILKLEISGCDIGTSTRIRFKKNWSASKCRNSLLYTKYFMFMLVLYKFSFYLHLSHCGLLNTVTFKSLFLRIVLLLFFKLPGITVLWNVVITIYRR
jgi:hypothetical protein